MRVPIIMLSGVAGSGKDTVADILVKNHGAVKIAQADPMKRLAAQLFGFSEETLWGPSERRKDDADFSRRHREPLSVIGTWVEDVLPGHHDIHRARHSLNQWFGKFLRDPDMPPAARRVLQTLGTEWGRAFSKNMWVDFALRNAQRLLVDPDCDYQCDTGVVSTFHRKCYDLAVITDGRFRNELLAVRAAGGATIKIESPNSGLTAEASQHSSETEQNTIPDSWFDAILTNHKEDGLAALESVVRSLLAAIEGCPAVYSTRRPRSSR